MPDSPRNSCSGKNWNQLVRERLGALGIGPEREEEVIAELAGHLQDRSTAAINNGMTEPEAVAIALEEVPDWVGLNHEISASKKEDPMNERTRILWLPGMTALFCSAVLLMLITRVLPPTIWADPKTPTMLYSSWVFSYFLFGAMGAYWSRRAGGSVASRFLSGIFPMGLHLAIFFLVIGAAMLSSAPRFPEQLQLSFQLQVFTGFVFVPGVALTLGTLPFLRNHASDVSRVSA